MNESYPTLIEQYRRDGFCMLPGVLPSKLIDAHLRNCEERFVQAGLPQTPEPEDHRHNQILLSLSRNDGSCGKLQFHPSLLDFISALLNEAAPILVIGSTGWREKGREPHSDTMMLLRDPPDHVCRTWCALEDIHPDSGIFYVIPGSHRSVRPGLYAATLARDPGIRDVLTSPEADDYAANRRIWQIVCDVTAERVAAMTRYPFRLRKGDVVVFDPNAIHGTMPVANAALTRKTMILEWHARDVRSYPVSAYFGPDHDRRHPNNGRLTAARAHQGTFGWQADD